MKKLIQVVCAFAAAALLAGCSGKSEDKIPGPVAFDKHDRCHICGMVILNYPGAKAQVFVKGEKEPLKFCLCSAAGECKTNRGFLGFRLRQ